MVEDKVVTGMEALTFGEIAEITRKEDVCIMQNKGGILQPRLQWKSDKYYTFLVCVCSLRYPACNAHAPYCHL
jgi:hypothetical protein